MVTSWVPVGDHRAVPVETRRGRTVCVICGGVVRTWADGRFPIHAEPRPERVCLHLNVERDDDGLDRRFHWCRDCHEEVVLTEPDEDGHSEWEVMS